MPFALSYNSQLWFQEGSTQIKLGSDVGFGFGWKLLAGSVTQVWSGYDLAFYLFTDSTGAEYRLDVNEGCVWRSRQGVYVFYDTNTGRLNFPDGSFWILSAVSAVGEQDAGTAYPTIMRDSNGNEVRLAYAQGIGGAWADSSARLLWVEDVRAVQIGGYASPYRTYALTYNAEALPHLIGITSYIWSAENWTPGYLAGQTLETPFSPPQSGGTAHLLAGWQRQRRSERLRRTSSVGRSDSGRTPIGST